MPLNLRESCQGQKFEHEMLEIVCFTGTSGLTDYAVSLARACGAHARLVTSTLLPERFRGMGFEVLTPFRRSRQYPQDLLRFVYGTASRRPSWSLWQGPLKLPVLDGMAARWLRWRGVRCAVTVHDVLPHYPKPWSRLTFGFYYRSFERVVVHSNAALDGLRKMGVHAPALVVPHGVYDLFRLTGIGREAARESLAGLEGRSDALVVLFFGHLEVRKGLFDLLHVAERLCHDSRFCFLISGGMGLNAADEFRFREHVERLSNVVLHARRVPFEEVEAYFSASDIVALPYKEGTTSGVLKLAIAFGKPVVASAIGDLPEEIPAQAGLCVPRGEGFVERFAIALNEIASDHDRWRVGMASVAERLQWHRIAAQLQAFLLITPDPSRPEDA